MADEERSEWKASKDAWAQLGPAARENRKSATPAEAKLWQALRPFRAHGFPFRRQHAIGNYIVDFYCAKAALVVEVDGPIHDGQTDSDANRSSFLESNSLRVLRFANNQVLQNLPTVLSEIRSVYESLSVDTERGLG